MANQSTKATEDFLAAKMEIDAMLEMIVELSNDHFGANPEKINWGLVGDMRRYRDSLREVTDMILGEG